jgi:hypothetical protein
VCCKLNPQIGDQAFGKKLRLDEITPVKPSWWYEWLDKKERDPNYYTCSVSPCDTFHSITMQQEGSHQMLGQALGLPHPQNPEPIGKGDQELEKRLD